MHAETQEVGRTAAPLTLIVEKGRTFALPFTVKADGVAVNLSGHTIRAEVRDLEGTLIFPFDVTIGTDLPNGVVQLNLTFAQTDTLDDCKTYFYDVYDENPGPPITRDPLIAGSLKVIRTRSDPP